MERIDDGKTAFKRWYDKNKVEFNARRKARYQQDAQYRNARIAEARRYRDDSQISDEPYVIEHGGKQITVYTVKQVAEWLGRPAETLRYWESKGWIPKVDVEPIAYTKKQAMLIRRIHMARNEIMSDESFDRLVSTVHAQWEE